MTTALILAGTRPGGDPLAGIEGKLHKALIDVAGSTLLERVIGAIRAAGIDRIGVSCDEGPVADLARAQNCIVMRTGAGPSESANIAFAAFGAPLLVTTVDHALLQPEWARELIDGTPPDADLSIAMAKREDVEAAMPGSKRTYLHFADGSWSGCNLFYLQTMRSEAALAAWSNVEKDRKRPWRIVGKLGPAMLANYAIGRLALADGIARLGRRLGVEACLVRASNGLAAVDVDNPQDLFDIRELLASD